MEVEKTYRYEWKDTKFSRVRTIWQKEKIGTVNRDSEPYPSMRKELPDYE